MVLLFPIALVVALLPLSFSAELARVLMLASGIGALRAVRRLRRQEAVWMSWSGIYLAGIVASCVAVQLQGSLPPELRTVGLLDCARQAFILVVCAALVLALRGEAARRLFAAGMTVLAIACVSIIVACYVLYCGLSPSGLFNPAVFKLHAFEAYGIAINPLSFATVVAGVTSAGWWARRPRWRWAMIAALACGVILSGTRTTQVAVIAAVAVTAIFYVMRRQPLGFRIAITLLVCALTTVIGLFFVASPVEINPYTITALTTGRVALWIAGFQKFLAQPVTGWGVGTWQVGLASYMPEYTEYGADAFVESLKAGAFHNAYLTALAERGLIAFLPGCVLLWLALREAFLIRRLGEGSETDRLFALVAPFGIVALIFRGVGEQGGVFGNADALVDFAVLGLCAQVIATAVAARREQGRRRIGGQDSVQQV